jgi:hypothetical protein
LIKVSSRQPGLFRNRFSSLQTDDRDNRSGHGGGKGAGNDRPETERNN